MRFVYPNSSRWGRSANKAVSTWDQAIDQRPQDVQTMLAAGRICFDCS